MWRFLLFQMGCAPSAIPENSGRPGETDVDGCGDGMGVTVAESHICAIGKPRNL